MNVNVNSLEANADFALFPLHLPGSTQTVQPPGYADRGVPRSIYSAIQPLAIVVDPLVMLANSKNGALGGLLEAYDTVTVWVNGVATGASDYVKPGKESERMLLHLQPGWFNDGVNTMRYRVERLSGNYEDSLPLKVLYYNPASNITVIHPASISLGQTGTVNINITYARPYSSVTLTIGTWSITFTNFDHTKPIIYPLTAADLQQIGVGNHSVSAIIRDQLSNSNISPTTSIDIRANQAPLTIDQSLMVLDGYKLFSSNGWTENEVARNVETRQAMDGVEPYSYESLDTSIVSVSQTGKVAGLRTGRTSIRVRDQTNNTVLFPVEVKNVFTVIKSSLFYSGSAGHINAQHWIQSVGGTTSTAPMTAEVLNANFRYVAVQVFDGLVLPNPNAIHIVNFGIPFDGYSALNMAMLANGTMWYSLGWVDTVSRAMAFVPR